jgi:diacylglycerol kinase (ATP)
MADFFKTRSRSFKYAFSGWWYVIRTQKNAWIHMLVSILVILVNFWLGLDSRAWAVIILAIALVWISEFLNTALEAVVDLASPSQHYLARVGKDVGAAAVLIAAVSSALIGLLIIGPPLFEKLSSFYSTLR